MITTWVLFILTLIFGYYLGRASKTSEGEMTQDIAQAVKGVKKLLKSKPKPGPIKALTQEQVYRREHPKEAEEEKEMSKAFSELVEFKPEKDDE